MDDRQPPPQNTFPPIRLVCGSVARIRAPPDSPSESAAMVRPAWRAAVLIALAGSWCAPLAAEEPDGTQPLHERIDRLVETAQSARWLRSAAGPRGPRMAKLTACA